MYDASSDAVLAGELAHFTEASDEELARVFGYDVDLGAVHETQARFEDGDALPDAQLAELPEGVRGAYVDGKIYLDADLSVSERREVYREELGHLIDDQLRAGGDSLGDEGARFRQLTSGEDVQPELGDDHGIVSIKGKAFTAEFSDSDSEDDFDMSAMGDFLVDLHAAPSALPTEDVPDPQPVTHAPHPTGAGLAQHPTVITALNDAWAQSEADGLEHGGFIYEDENGQIHTVEAASGASGHEIDLDNPPEMEGWTLVGNFHTHPNGASDDWKPTPSQADHENAAVRGVPGLVRTVDGDGDDVIYSYGPTYREGRDDANPSDYPRRDPASKKYDFVMERDVSSEFSEWSVPDEHPGVQKPPRKDDDDTSAGGSGGSGGGSTAGASGSGGGSAGGSEGSSTDYPAGTTVPYHTYRTEFADANAPAVIYGPSDARDPAPRPPTADYEGLAGVLGTADEPSAVAQDIRAQLQDHVDEDPRDARAQLYFNPTNGTNYGYQVVFLDAAGQPMSEIPRGSVLVAEMAVQRGSGEHDVSREAAAAAGENGVPVIVAHATKKGKDNYAVEPLGDAVRAATDEPEADALQEEVDVRLDDTLVDLDGQNIPGIYPGMDLEADALERAMEGHVLRDVDSADDVYDQLMNLPGVRDWIETTGSWMGQKAIDVISVLIFSRIVDARSQGEIGAGG